jgi:polar amino acid transport system substrate-binding protein
MNKSKILYAMILVSFFVFNKAYSASSDIDDYNILIDNFPPYNYKDGNDYKGIAVELLGEILKDLNARQDITKIKSLPWAEAYNEIKHKENTMLFSMLRSKEREKMFKWAGPIAPVEIVLISLANRKIEIDTPRKVRKYKIAAIGDDIGEMQLKILWVSRKIVSVNSFSELLDKLEKAEVSMIAIDRKDFDWQIKEKGLKPKDFKVVYELTKGESYFAFHHDTPDELITKFQSSLDKIKKNEKYTSSN